MKSKIWIDLKSISIFRESCLLILTVIIFSANLYSQEEIKPEDLFKMSLEELMDVVIYTGSLTGTNLSKIPANITIITREYIENTPARNIF